MHFVYDHSSYLILQSGYVTRIFFPRNYVTIIWFDSNPTSIPYAILAKDSTRMSIQIRRLTTRGARRFAICIVRFVR